MAFNVASNGSRDFRPSLTHFHKKKEMLKKLQEIVCSNRFGSSFFLEHLAMEKSTNVFFFCCGLKQKQKQKHNNSTGQSVCVCSGFWVNVIKHNVFVCYGKLLRPLYTSFNITSCNLISTLYLFTCFETIMTNRCVSTFNSIHSNPIQNK